MNLQPQEETLPLREIFRNPWYSDVPRLADANALESELTFLKATGADNHARNRKPVPIPPDQPTLNAAFGASVTLANDGSPELLPGQFRRAMVLALGDQARALGPMVLGKSPSACSWQGVDWDHGDAQAAWNIVLMQALGLDELTNRELATIPLPEVRVPSLATALSDYLTTLDERMSELGKAIDQNNPPIIFDPHQLRQITEAAIVPGTGTLPPLSPNAKPRRWNDPGLIARPVTAPPSPAEAKQAEMAAATRRKFEYVMPTEMMSGPV